MRLRPRFRGSARNDSGGENRLRSGARTRTLCPAFRTSTRPRAAWQPVHVLGHGPSTRNDAVQPSLPQQHRGPAGVDHVDARRARHARARAERIVRAAKRAPSQVARGRGVRPSSIGVDTATWVRVPDPRHVERERRARRALRAVERRGVRAAHGKLRVDHCRRSHSCDYGSGKGRVLMLAAEYPFKRIVGVEFAKSLHDISQENVATLGSEAGRIETFHADATEFDPPTDPLVLYFFHPFGVPALKQVALARPRLARARAAPRVRRAHRAAGLRGGGRGERLPARGRGRARLDDARRLRRAVERPGGLGVGGGCARRGRLLQALLADLPGRRLRQLVEEVHACGHHEALEPLAAGAR